MGAAARVLYSGGVLAAAALVAVAASAALLVPAGLWRPVLALPLIALVLAGVVAVLRPALRPPPPAEPWPVWCTPACIAIAAGHGIWAALTAAEHVVLRRDAGSYALYAQWIATRHGLPVDAQLDAFGGAAALADPAFRLASPAFFEVTTGGGAAAGAHLVPQFLLGAPAWYSLGWWAGGWDGLLFAPAVTSALAVLAVAGLAARLLGPRWAVLATLLVAVAFPVLHVARSTYSEPPALLLVAVAGSLATDALRSRDRRTALVAGATAGLAGLVRVDAIREVALLLPVCAALAVRRHPAGAPLALGALAGTAVSAVPALMLSRPYLDSISASLLPLLAGTVALGVLSAAWVLLARGDAHRLSPQSRPPRGDDAGRWLTDRWAVAAGGAVVGLGLLLATRPLWMTTRQSPRDPGSKVVAGLQLRQGLTVDGGRTYAEHSLEWVSWYLGPLTVAAAWLTFGVLAARAVHWWRGRSRDAPPWLAVAVVALGSLVLTLVRPGITPDHPWADRRLVPVVLPAVAVAAVAALATAVRQIAGRSPGPPSVSTSRRTGGVALTLVGGLLLLVPPIRATAPLAAVRTEQGERAAVAAVCAALEPGDAVIAVDSRGANEWPQAVRGTCDRPAASLRLRGGESDAEVVAALRRVAARTAAAGSRPVALAGTAEGARLIAAAGGRPVRVVALETREDQRRLVRRPDGTARLDVDVWLAPGPPPAEGTPAGG